MKRSLMMRFGIVLGLVLSALFSPFARASDRLTVFISDLHFGVGRVDGGDWHPFEDFRWPGALDGFLREISAQGQERVDLVIVGDLLELWQRPKGFECRGVKDAGCSETETAKLMRRIVASHDKELQSLRAFAHKGSNHIFVVPGNHDAALMLSSIWKLLADNLGATDGVVTLVASGIWISADKMLVAEHGHQIGSDVNSFPNWPSVTAPDGLMVRPWGESFVQSLFNREEEKYPIIDNIIPESEGAKFRLADRGLARSATDIAKFLAFNVLQTSFAQKVQALTPAGNEDGAAPFDRAKAIENSDLLLTATMDNDDPLRTLLSGNKKRAQAIRAQWRKTLSKLQEEDLKAICQGAAVASSSSPCGGTLAAAAAAAAGKLLPKDFFMKRHLERRMDEFGDFSVFIYGHTHGAEVEREVQLSGHTPVSVANTGAFQRLVDGAGFKKRAQAKNWSQATALRKLRPEDLAPCYGAVVVEPYSNLAEPHLRVWVMEEGLNNGRWQSPGSSACE